MTTKVFSASMIGLECEIIEVQADISQGLPAFNIVGLGDASVQESKERVRASIRNSGANFPMMRKTINLAPAQIRKQGALFDLPIAVSLLIECGELPASYFNSTLLVGELSLSGRLRPIKGALSIAHKAQKQGFKRIILPIENAPEASFISGIKICPIDSLKNLIKHAVKSEEIPQIKQNNIVVDLPHSNSFQNIAGLETAKRALTIAAAGGHNVLLEGSPGCGKTIICRAFKAVLPPMNSEEILETSKIYSVAGLMPDISLIKTRPFREVHPTASVTSIIGGGGYYIKPGEITLAHNGVLFLDEIAEFKAKTLDALRQPLEDNFITITRLNQSYKFPSNFMLIATMNPCPCGFYGDKKIDCRCTPHQIKQYRNKISGPILDRFDLFVRPERFSLSNAIKKHESHTSNQLQQSIQQARVIQEKRFERCKIRQNSEMSLRNIRQMCRLKTSAHKMLDQANQKMHLSSRAYLKTIKIARTIADLENSKYIQDHHIAEALQYRYPHSKQ